MSAANDYATRLAQVGADLESAKAALQIAMDAERAEQSRLIDERDTAHAELEDANRRHDADVAELKRQRDEALAEVRGLRSCLAKIALALGRFESRSRGTPPLIGASQDVGNKRIFEMAGYPEEWLEADDKTQPGDEQSF